METTLFYILAAAILVFSILTVTSRRILRAAVYLLFTLVATSAIYFLLNYDFLAAVQLTVYAGGIVVVIIFSILLTSHIDHKLEMPSFKKTFFSALIAAAGAAICLTTILQYDFSSVAAAPASTSIESIGKQLLSYDRNGYILPFEVISILLLAAMLGTIIIAKREKSEAK